MCTPIAQHFNADYDGPTRVPKCRTPVDLVLPDLKIAIEYDSWYWHLDTSGRDNRKTTQLQNGEWTVIRIRKTSRGRQLPYVEGILIAADVNECSNKVAERVIAVVEQITRRD